jgi:hypothetical protein
MPQMNGGCLCGQLRYAANTEPIFSAVCHCKTCQKQTGTAFRIVVAVPQSAVSIQGSLKTCTRAGDTGQRVVNRFCPRGRRLTCAHWLRTRPPPGWRRVLEEAEQHDRLARFPS